MTIQNLPTLTYIELVRAKLRVYSRRDGSWDGEDLIFILSSFGDQVDKSQVKEKEARYFIDNFNWEGHEDEKKAMIRALLVTDGIKTLKK
ncbi:hypothetical protein FRB93_011507 [Tulasnella sp. JGI-2019a]|nr:hypothetical protein FRB93_011507 [Tulasnella sp. JGI-2019a]